MNEVGGQRGIDRIDVVGNTTDDVSRGVRIEIGDGQDGEIFKELFPHSIGDFLTEMNHDHGEEIGEDSRDDVAEQHAPKIEHYDVHLYAVLIRDGVDCRAEITGAEQSEIVGEERKGDSRQSQGPIHGRFLIFEND